MSLEGTTVAIITTAHWKGDARLNRHVEHLGQAGLTASLQSYSDETRVRALGSALRHIASKPATVVILPDPELFFLGSLVARLRGLRPIVDIHEDYPRVARGREWVPRPLRGIVGRIARVAVALGRMTAADVVVAAPDIARSGDVVVSNVPDPAFLGTLHDPGKDSRELVYVGDVTEARGSAEMVELLGRLGPPFTLRVIGRVSQETEAAMREAAAALGVAQQLFFEGRLPLGQAWSTAAGSLAGLNLLRDLPAYRTAVATKLWEYMAVGIPPVVTDLPGQAAVVNRVDPRLGCPDVDSAADIIRAMAEDPRLRQDIVARADRLAREAWDENRPDLALQRLVSPDL